MIDMSSTPNKKISTNLGQNGPGNVGNEVAFHILQRGLSRILCMALDLVVKFKP